MQADLTDEDDITRLVDRTVEESGGIKHLAASAGGPPSGPFLEMDDDNLLVMSVVRTIREAVPHLRDGGGIIVTITSRSVKEAIKSLVLSNSVRMSVIGLEKTLSKELGPDVRVNAVLPGPHETSRIQNLVEAGVERGEYESYEARGQANPFGRIGDPRELGDTVAYLFSPRAGYINGESILIDGGQSSSNL